MESTFGILPAVGVVAQVRGSLLGDSSSGMQSRRVLEEEGEGWEAEEEEDRTRLS